MGSLVGASGQNKRYFLYDASGTITTGGTPQLVLAQRQSCSYLMIQNNSAGPLFVEVGSARATCTINASGVVNSITITNSGFNFTYAPLVRFYGGGNAGNSKFLGLNLPGGEGPSQKLTKQAHASAVATVSGGSVNAINLVQNDSGYVGGNGYVKAPFVFLINSDLDPYGCATPSASSGIQLAPNGGTIFFEDTTCTTDPIAIFGATNGQAFTCKWMP